MRIIPAVLFILFFILPISLKSQNAPVTKIGTVINATTDPGAVTVPVTVSDFVSIGYFRLTIMYPANLVSYVSATPHASFPGMIVSNNISGTLGFLVITWPQTPGGVTLPDETTLLFLTFTYISGTASLTWMYTAGYICEYKKYYNGNYLLLNDSPETTYYLNGGISNRGAPEIFAPVLLNPSAGNLPVPVTVNDFTTIAAMTLSLEYNQAVLSYVNCTPNPGLSGVFNAGTMMGPNGKMLLTISWVSTSNVSLTDGSTVFTVNYIYSTANASCTALRWYDDGSSCEFGDQQGNSLVDSPVSDYYHNGLIYTQFSPQTWLPVETGASPGPVSLPVFVNDFNNVRSFTLSYEYDGSVMTYNGFTPDTAFGSALTVVDSPFGPKRKITLTWTGAANKTLPDGSLVATVNFTWNSGVSTLKWIVSDGTSCRFNDSNGNAYFDEPKAGYYMDGLLASHVSPITVGGQRSAVGGQSVTVPLYVYNFTNIGLFSFTLDYDPSVLTYGSASLVPVLGGTFTTSTAGLGRILIDWSGADTTLADSSALINLTFTYNGGSSTLAWYDNGSSCRYAESSSGPSLYDQPKSFYYINGYTGPNPLVADFIANNANRSYDTTIALTDLSTGGPATWNWTISPSSYYFTDGTDAGSQNPVVKFTSNGSYTVTLIVTRGTSGAVRVRTDYMYIGTPGLWTGIASGNWYEGSNWHNFRVPDTSLHIVIPNSAPNWPHLTGNLIIGELCEHITMQGAANLLVDGDLTIEPGAALNLIGAGLVKVGGDWLNAGTFNTGSSTVEFTGANDASISGISTPQTFYKIMVSKPTGSTLFIKGTVNITGTE